MSRYRIRYEGEEMEPFISSDAPHRRKTEEHFFSEKPLRYFWPKLEPGCLLCYSSKEGDLSFLADRLIDAEHVKEE